MEAGGQIPPGFAASRWKDTSHIPPALRIPQKDGVSATGSGNLTKSTSLAGCLLSPSSSSFSCFLGSAPNKLPTIEPLPQRKPGECKPRHRHAHTRAHTCTQSMRLPAPACIHTSIHACACVGTAHTSTCPRRCDAGNVVAPPSPACSGDSSSPVRWAPSSGQYPLQSRSCSPCLLPSPPECCSTPGDKRETGQRFPVFKPGLSPHGPHPPPTLNSKPRLCRRMMACTQMG